VWQFLAKQSIPQARQPLGYQIRYCFPNLKNHERKKGDTYD
jgi:hypothetical protein